MQLLLLLFASAAASPVVAGLYEAHQMELGAALELQANGHFQYQLDYGAVSEQAGGDWTFDGKTVRLTSRPMPKLPSFELVRDDPAPVAELSMKLEPPGVEEGYRMQAVATGAADGIKRLIIADETGRVDTEGHGASVVQPVLPGYVMTGDRFVLSPGRGHRLLFRFHAGNLGNAKFASEPLGVTDSELVLNRYDISIRFIRVRP